MFKPRVLNYKTKLFHEDGINVMRPSAFGNPFIIPRDGDRDIVCDKFENYVNNNPTLIKKIKAELRGKNLICCCVPHRCHAHTLLRIANELDIEDYL